MCVQFPNRYSKRKNKYGTTNNRFVTLSHAQLSVSTAFNVIIFYLTKRIKTIIVYMYLLIALTYFVNRNLTSVKIVDDEVLTSSVPSRYVHVVDPFASEITFNLGTCPSKKVLHVACNDAGKWIIVVVYTALRE